MGSKTPAPVQTTNVTTQQLAPEQTELLGLAMPHLRNFAAAPPQLPSFSNVAGFDPAQVAGQEQVLNAAQGYSGALTNAQSAYEALAPRQQGIADTATNTYDRLTSGDLLSPESNPYLRAHMDSAVASAAAPIWQGLSEQVLPNIRGSAAQTGYGSSRQGIAEGIASGRAAQEVGRQGQGIATTLADLGYGRGLDAMGRALGMTGTVQSAQAAPAEAMRTAAGLAGEQVNPALWTSGVGDVRQGLQQQILGEQTDRWNYNQNLPLMAGRELASIIGGIPGGGSTVQGVGPGAAQKNPLLAGLGGAASGAMLGQMLIPIPGVGAAAGALGGAALGALA